MCVCFVISTITLVLYLIYYKWHTESSSKVYLMTTLQLRTPHYSDHVTYCIFTIFKGHIRICNFLLAFIFYDHWVFTIRYKACIELIVVNFSSNKNCMQCMDTNPWPTVKFVTFHSYQLCMCMHIKCCMYATPLCSQS